MELLFLWFYMMCGTGVTIGWGLAEKTNFFTMCLIWMGWPIVLMAAIILALHKIIEDQYFLIDKELKK